MSSNDDIDFDAIERREDTHFNIPKDFRWAKFSARLLRERVKPASAIDRALGVTELPIVLTGKAGAGKTALGCALLRRFSEKLGVVGCYADTIKLSYARKIHPLGMGEAPALSAAMNAPLLFLDELGAEEGLDQAIDQLVRLRFRRPTIFATPHRDLDIVARYGDGFARRVYDGATVIKLSGAK